MTLKEWCGIFNDKRKVVSVRVNGEMLRVLDLPVGGFEDLNVDVFEVDLKTKTARDVILVADAKGIWDEIT